MADLLYWLVSNLIRTFFAKIGGKIKKLQFLSKFNFVTVSDKDICWHNTTGSEHNQWKLKKKGKKNPIKICWNIKILYLPCMWIFWIWPLLDSFLNNIATSLYIYSFYCKSITHRQSSDPQRWSFCNNKKLKLKSSNFGNWPVAVEFIMETVVRVKETSRNTTRIWSSCNNQLKEKNIQVPWKIKILCIFKISKILEFVPFLDPFSK